MPIPGHWLCNRHQSSFIDALYYRAVTFHNMMRLDEAVADLTRAAAIKPSAQIFHYLGALFHELRKRDEAVENYEEALTAPA